MLVLELRRAQIAQKPTQPTVTRTVADCPNILQAAGPPPARKAAHCSMSARRRSNRSVRRQAAPMAFVFT